MPVFIFVASFDLEMSKKNSGGATVVHRHLSPEQSFYPLHVPYFRIGDGNVWPGAGRHGGVACKTRVFLLFVFSVLAVLFVAIAAIIRHLQLHNFVAAKCTFPRARQIYILQFAMLHFADISQPRELW